MPADAPTPPPGPSTGRDPRLFLGVMVLTGYALTARGVENLYPFSVFPMYAGTEGGAFDAVPYSRAIIRART